MDALLTLLKGLSKVPLREINSWELNVWKILTFLKMQLPLLNQLGNLNLRTLYLRMATIFLC